MAVARCGDSHDQSKEGSKPGTHFERSIPLRSTYGVDLQTVVPIDMLRFVVHFADGEGQTQT